MSNNSNTQQAFWVALGSLASFGFAIVSSMILSRYFDKNDYGTYKQVLYVYNTLLTVFTLGLPKAFSYYLPRVPLNEAKNLISKITRLFYFLGGVFSILLFICSGYIAVFLKNPDLALALKIFAPVPMLMMPTMGLEGILATYRKTKFLSIYMVVTRIFMLLCVALPVVLFEGDYIQALIGFVIASFLSFLLALYLKYLPIKNELNDKCAVSYREIISFSLPLVYASFWGILITSADQFFVSRYFGTEVFAEFSNGSMELPFVGMVVNACSIVLMPLFSKQISENVNPKKEIYPIWLSVFRKTAMIIYPMILFFMFFADTVMIVLYGQKYAGSSVYFQIKLVANLFTLIAYAPIILALGKTKYYANVHMYGAIILIILEYLSVILFESPYILTAISVACHIGRIVCMLYMISNYFEVKIVDIFPVGLIFKIVLPSTLILYFIKNLLLSQHFNELLTLVLALFTYVLLFIPLAIVMKIDYLSIVKQIIRK